MAFFGADFNTEKIEELLALTDEDTLARILTLLTEVVGQLRLITDTDLSELKEGERVST